MHLDEKRLAGYWNACKALTEDCDPSDSQNMPYNQINSLIRAQSYPVRAAGPFKGGGGGLVFCVSHLGPGSAAAAVN